MTCNDLPGHTADLFANVDSPPSTQPLGRNALVLRGFALPYASGLLGALPAILAAAPWRHLYTPGGLRMSVALTNCGALGWTSDRHGYRYTRLDPESGRPWPGMPPLFLELARKAAAQAGFGDFEADACLINRYEPGTRMALHQDKDERRYDAPIVSVSLGIAATFLFGGHGRSDRPLRIPLLHGDVVVWGGEDRLRYHGIAPLKAAHHPLLGAQRINLTLRQAA